MARAEDTEIIDKFEQFYRDYYRNEIGQLAQKYPNEQRSLYIEWEDLYRFDPDIADDFIAQPDQMREYAEEALRLYDLPVDVKLGQAHVRIHGLQKMTGIREIRARHRGQLVEVVGIIRKATDVRPKITEAAFECQRCGTLTRIPQTSGEFHEPHECQGCERQGPFEINFDQSEFVDAQKLRVQESPEGLRGGETPQNIDVHIDDDITGEVTAGDHVRVTGILHLDQQGSNQEKSPVFDVYMDGMSVEIEDEQFEDMDITEADKKRIIELSNESDIYEKMVASMAPSIYGYDQEKMAIIMQLFSGVTKHLPDGSRTRGDLHMLLIGDPGTGKSQLLQYVRNLAPRSVYTSGKGSSSAGLCVTGDTKIHTKEGFRPIRDLVTRELPEPVASETAAKQSTGVKTFDRDRGEMVDADASHVWRMPKKLCRRIETRHGKELEASTQTPVLVCGSNGIEWREISEIEAGDYVGVPRGFSERDGVEVSVRDFLELSTEKVRLSNESIAFLRDSLTETFGTLRDAAAELDLSEDFIYLHLKNRHVPIERLDRMVDAVGASRCDLQFDRLMVRHGDGITVPDEFDSDLMYLIGLVFGDGDISLNRRDGNRGMVRISNGNESILERASDIFAEKFDKRPEIEHQEDRVPAIRVNSVTIARLFSNVGMQTPKADLALAPELTASKHTDAFLRGLMDADGSVSRRDSGGSSVLISTISDELAQQVQLMLESYGVQASVRERDRRGTYKLTDGRTIESKHVQYFVEIYGADIDRYAKAIGFESEAKTEALEAATNTARRQKEKLPVGSALAAAEGSTGTYYGNVTRGDNPSPERAESMIRDLDMGPIETDIRETVDADLRWDEVVDAEDIGQKEVFDLTVPDTHNFVGNGIVTHNTAAAVRDDFGEGQQWTLEAGALVLADQGIAAVDELDKMRCVTGDTLVHLSNGRISRIKELAREAEREGDIEELSNGRTIRDVDLKAWTMSDDNRLVERPVTAIHEYEAPDRLAKVTLESGESVTATHDHPFFVFENGKRHKRPAADLERGDWTYVPEQLPEATTDGGTTSADRTNVVLNDTVEPSFGAVLGYLSGDGNIYYNRSEGSYGIRFTNKEEELLDDFERVCRTAFGKDPVRHPSEKRDDGVQTVRLHGREFAERVIEAGMNVETYEDKSFPTGLTSGTRRTKAAFIRAFADSEGNVDPSTGNVRMYSASEELLSGIKSLLLEFDVSCQIQTRERKEKRDLHVLTITSAESLRSYNRRIGFTLSRKQDALDEVCTVADGNRTVIDVLPNCSELFKQARASLRLYQSECGINDTTYCNFENGDANCSLHRAITILERFEERIETASRDANALKSDCSWDSLQKLKERYHISQRELADGTALSQQQISREWGDSEKIRNAAQTKLSTLIKDVTNTDLSPLSHLVNGDVKWRQVRSVENINSESEDDRIPVIRQEIADLLDCSISKAEQRALEVLRDDFEVDSWAALRDELDKYGISLRTLGSDLGVAGSTISRWSNGVVETDQFDTVSAAAETRISNKRSEVRELLNEIQARKETKVYDLTVEGTHNFVANGMIVHNSEDRSAMHEALEQQSYHPDTEILLADGRRVEIGDFVDERMAATPDQVTEGIDCEILPIDDTRIHSTDLETNETTKLSIDRVSRHEAPEEFVRITFSNGRDVTVTPEHPMFADQGGEIDTVEAREIETDAFVPAPRKLPNSSATVELDGEPHHGREKDVHLPTELSGDLAEILGFLVAEGHSYAGSSHEIGFSNQDERLLGRMADLMSSVFGMESADTTNNVGTVTKRWVSTKLYRWFESNFAGVMHTARDKRIPDRVLGASEEVIRRFLVGAFAGDGGVESEAMAFSTASTGLARDYADALSKIGVASRIHHDIAEDSWKVYVMGDSTERFVDAVIDPADERHTDAMSFVERSNETRRHHNVLPTSAAREIRDLKRLLGVGLTGKFRPNLDEGYGVQIETVREELEALRNRSEEVKQTIRQAETLAEIRDAIGWSGRQLADRIDGETTSTIHYAENGGYGASRRRGLTDNAREAAYGALEEFDDRADTLEDRCDLRYYRVTDVETIPNQGKEACKWVYDVTVEPTNTFISQGVVLHNSISISKAGINATLKSRCSLLGAANPKYGRFDQYEPIGEQIDLEPALISRFDLIFTVTDKPDAEKDANLAEHIINTNYAGELHTHRENTTTSDVSAEEVESVTQNVEPEIDAELLRKYIAYAKRNCYPMMSEEAKAQIRDFYVDLRAKGQDEDAPVPVTARKLEALVRLSEASARMRLSDTVEREDAERVIEIVRSCLKDIGVDPETGEFDADVVETGQSKTQRDRIKNIKALINEIESEYDEGAPIETVLDRAEEMGTERSQAEHEIEKLRRKGDVYEPATDHLRTV